MQRPHNQYTNFLVQKDLHPIINCSEAAEGKEYQVSFKDTGIYNIWVRGYGSNSSSDSIFVGVDGTCVGVLNPNSTYNQ